MKSFKAIHIFRIGLGINMLMHGLVRIPNLSGFVNKMLPMFAGTLMPAALTSAFLHVLPFIEALIGVMILLGGQISRIGYIAGGVLIAILIFGTDLRQDWATAGQQMIYITAFGVALHLHDKDRIVAVP